MICLVPSPGRRGATWFRVTVAISLLVVGCTPAQAHGDLHARIAALTAAIAENPRDATLHVELAWAYCQHEQWHEALATAAQAEQLSSGSAVMLLVRGRACVGLGRFADARVTLDLFLAAHPERHDVRLDRARALAGLGEAEASLADFRAMLEAAERPLPAVVVEVVDAFVAAGRRAEASALLAAATARAGHYPELALKALELALALERFDDAIRQAEILRDLAPRPESWMAERAMLLRRAGRVDEARTAWDELLRHIDALPNLDRGAPAMRALAEQAQSARDALSPSS